MDTMKHNSSVFMHQLQQEFIILADIMYYHAVQVSLLRGLSQSAAPPLALFVIHLIHCQITHPQQLLCTL
jgi:hypothetical protein